MRESVEQFFRDHFDLLPTKHPNDYYATLVGVAATVVFCFFLASLILRARRGNPADLALAVVAISWGCIALYSFYRLTHALAYIPLVSPLLWTFTVTAEFVATVLILRELRN